MAIEKDFFRQVRGRFITGVTVVTTTSQRKCVGFTITAFTFLSLTPPLVLICVDNATRRLSLFRESKIFAVNFLTAKQRHLSHSFATPLIDPCERFCHTAYHVAATGAPILDDVMAFVDTRLVAEYPGGDHVIFVGEVEAIGTAGRVIFASKEGRARSTLVGYHDYATSPSHGSAPIEDAAPLAYYRGQHCYLATYDSEPSFDRE